MGEEQATDVSRPTAESTFRDPLVEQLSAVGSFFREHPAIVGSLLYLQVTTVGVVYSWVLFSRFDINVFDYAEANDFLLAAFKNPAVFAMSMFTLFAFPLLFFIIWRRQQRQLAARTEISTTGEVTTTTKIGPRRTTMFVVTFLIVIVYSLVPPFIFAGFTADALQHANNEPLVSVQYRATEGSNDQTEETGLRVIGTTQNFVFFYDGRETKTLVIPTAQIVEMTHCVEKESSCE